MVKSRKRGIGAYAAIVFLLWIPLLASCDSKTAEKYIREAEADRAAGSRPRFVLGERGAHDTPGALGRIVLARDLDLLEPTSHAAPSP